SPFGNTTYYVTITDAQSCTYQDSVQVNVREAAVFSVSADNSACINSPYELNASGGTSYLWSPAINLNNPGVANPHATVTATTTFSVLIKEEICNESATLTTTLTALPLPVLNTSKSNDINC